MRRSQLNMLFALLAVAAVFLSESQVTPALACNPNRTNDLLYYWDGWSYSSSTQQGGVYATLDVRNPYVCCGAQDSDYAVRVRESSTSKGASWAWIDYGGSGITDLATWPCSSGECTAGGYGTYTINTSATFTILWDPNSKTVSWQSNGSPVDSRVLSVSFYPQQASVTGEITTLGNQMPGNSSSPAAARNPYMYVGGWTRLPDNPGTNNSTFFYHSLALEDGHGNLVNGGIYDNSCSS
jgi:hypothetical protein